jgi:hypothetical protein
MANLSAGTNPVNMMIGGIGDGEDKNALDSPILDKDFGDNDKLSSEGLNLEGEDDTSKFLGNGDNSTQQLNDNNISSSAFDMGNNNNNNNNNQFMEPDKL